METPKIELYRTRTFSDKISDSFGFLRENWRALLKYFVYLFVPASIVVALPFNHHFKLITEIIGNQGFNDSDAINVALTMAGSLLGIILGAILLESLVYSMVRLYQIRPNRLQLLQFDEFKPHLFHCMKRSVVLVLTGILIMLCVLPVFAIIGGLLYSIDPSLSGVVVLALAGMFYIFLLVVLPPLMLVSPIYMLEDDIHVFGAFRKAFHLGFPTWGGIFAVMFVMGVVGYFLQMFTMIPFYVMGSMKLLFTFSQNDSGAFTHTFAYALIQYVMCVVMVLGIFLSNVMTMIGITFQYGHASDKIDGTGVSNKIDQFDSFDNF